MSNVQMTTFGAATFALFSFVIRISSFVNCLKGCLSGVEPLPSGSQPAVQKPLHHRHRVREVPRPGFEPRIPRSKRGVMIRFTIEAQQRESVRAFHSSFVLRHSTFPQIRVQVPKGTRG